MLHEADAYLLHSLRRILTLYIPQDGCLSLLFRDMNAYLYAPKVDAYLFYSAKRMLIMLISCVPRGWCLFITLREANAYFICYKAYIYLLYSARRILITLRKADLYFFREMGP